MNCAGNPAAPWYRVGMVWLLIAFPLASVVGGFAMLALALASEDGLVADDYYRRGMEINRELARDRAAAARGVTAEVRLDDALREAAVLLDVPRSAPPARLELRLLHATRAGFDREFSLHPAPDGSYRAAPLGLVPGRYYLELAAHDWRLLGSLEVPGERQVPLRPGAP